MALDKTRQNLVIIKIISMEDFGNDEQFSEGNFVDKNGSSNKRVVHGYQLQVP